MTSSVFDYNFIRRRIRQLNGEPEPTPKCPGCSQHVCICTNCPTCQLPAAICICPAPPTASPACPLCLGTGRQSNPYHPSIQIPCASCFPVFYPFTSNFTCHNCCDVGHFFGPMSQTWLACTHCGNPYGKPKP